MDEEEDVLDMNSFEDPIVIFRARQTIQMSTSTISFVASSAILIMILMRSNRDALSTPYRRLIFGLSLGDILASLGLMLGPISTPTDTPDSFFSMGNTATCSANGFMQTLGSVATPMYTCSLCFYYYCKLKHGMDNYKFRRTIEWWLHALIIIYSFTLSIMGLATKSFNALPNGMFCHFAGYPIGCDIPDLGMDTPCIRGEHAVFMTIFASIVPYALAFCVIVYSMVGLTIHVFLQGKIHGRPASSACSTEEPMGRTPTASRSTSPNDASCFSLPGHVVDEEMKSMEEKQSFKSASASAAVAVPSAPAPAPPASLSPPALPLRSSTANSDTPICNLREPDESATEFARRIQSLYVKETMKQASLYIISFVTIYFFPILSTVYSLALGREVSNYVYVLLWLFFPLGGLFNIFVYTRPKVIAIRLMKDVNLSFLEALWMVIKAGGDIPDEAVFLSRVLYSDEDMNSPVRFSGDEFEALNIRRGPKRNGVLLIRRAGDFAHSHGQGHGHHNHNRSGSTSDDKARHSLSNEHGGSIGVLSTGAEIAHVSNQATKCDGPRSSGHSFSLSSTSQQL